MNKNAAPAQGTCEKCKGKGKFRQRVFDHDDGSRAVQMHPCSDCNGTGRAQIEMVCPTCQSPLKYVPHPSCGGEYQCPNDCDSASPVAAKCICGHGRNDHHESGDLGELWCDFCGASCTRFEPAAPVAAPVAEMPSAGKRNDCMEKRGLVKLVEECGELCQIAAKKMTCMDTDDHWDGAGSLKERLEKEMGDVRGAIQFVSDMLNLDHVYINNRAVEKTLLFHYWNNGGKETKLPTAHPPEDAAVVTIEGNEAEEVINHIDLNNYVAGSTRDDIFYVAVKDDSYARFGIESGDLIVVNRALSARNNQRVVFIENGTAAITVLQRGHPENIFGVITHRIHKFQ